MSIWEDFLTYRSELLGGLLVSLELALFTLALGIPLGLLLAVGSSARSKLPRWVSIGLVEIGRGTPALVMLQLVYTGLPRVGFTFTTFVSAALALALTTAAYTSEIIRGGLQAVPAGEIEASEALGMPRRDVLRFVIIPQGLRIAIPPLVGFSIIMFQATSLVYTIAGNELMSQAKQSAAISFRYFNLFLIAGLLYAAITIPASWLTDRIEHRMSRHL